ncbi:hypothetical protein IWQ56_005412 [Coemansia nantahalensis]|nr:hypothetical protein IWQ56_005412 [Coemansia nantahalensis]
MGPGSARDLLRRAREQKKKRQPAGGGSGSLVDDPQVRVTAAGAMQCAVCDVGVRPADAMGWKAHRNSPRHLQKQQALQLARKREAEHDIAAGVSDSLQTQLTIAQEPTAEKRRKLDGVSGYASSSSNGEEPPAEALDVRDAVPGGLPASFFDQGVEPADASSDDDGRSGDDRDAGGDASGVPAGFFDASAETVPQADANLEESLAAFERDISGLPQAPDAPAAEEPDEPDGNAAEQGDQWAVRTQRLVRLRAIIKDGQREMDPSEGAAMEQASSSGSDSDCDFAEFESWRRGQM